MSSYQTGDGYMAESGLELGMEQLQFDAASQLPMFVVEQVQMQFSIAADFVAAQVANNVLVLALSNGRILRIDLNKPEDIDDIDLPKKPSDVGVIRRMFLDPTASHLIICTAQGENYYLHSQTKNPRPLARLRGVTIESVAWNPSFPTASTREILVGASDGNIYEIFIETATEFYKKEVKHLRNVAKLPDGPISGLYVDSINADNRRVLVSTPTRLLHYVGKVGLTHDSGGSIYMRLFEAEQPTVHDFQGAGGSGSAPSALVTSPDAPAKSPDDEDDPSHATHGEEDDDPSDTRAFAWLSGQGIFHGKLLQSPLGQDLGSFVYSASSMIPRSQLVESSGRRAATEVVSSVALTQWHVIALVGPRVVVTNRLTGETVYDQVVLDQGEGALGFSVDVQKNTFWLFTPTEIFEIVVRDEDRNVWQIMMKTQKYPVALKYARTPPQRETVATAYGDYLMKKEEYLKAADMYARSNKTFEEATLGFLDVAAIDALRQYLVAKLALTKKTAIMQRKMMATWLVELFMARLDSYEDDIMAQTEVVPGDADETSVARASMDSVRDQFQSFVVHYKDCLDKQTVYDMIGSHGRERELLYFAEMVADHNYILQYWVQRERWSKVLDVLKRQTDPEVFYKYSSVLLSNVPTDTIEILMRHTDLKTRRLIPALLEYNRTFKGSVHKNQAIRYLLYTINQLRSDDAAVHNTLVSMYAGASEKDEAALLGYLESQGEEPHFDPDFALRQCIENHRTLSCVHIYTNMGQYLQAVDLALSHGEIELAANIADRTMSNSSLRRKLWLAIARKVITRASSSSQALEAEDKKSSSGGPGVGIKAAIDFLKRCDLLKIEDLIPFFPDFVVIDDFKEDICTALEEYSHSIDALKEEMDEAALTAANIASDINALSARYAIVEPGEKCYICTYPLLSRQFFVFPCQHAFHSDCLGKQVVEMSGLTIGARIKELQVLVGRGMVPAAKREVIAAELDNLVGAACVLCGEGAVRRIDEPFVREGEDVSSWVL